MIFLMKVLNFLLSLKVDFADLFYEDTKIEEIFYGNRKIIYISSGNRKGLGIRIINHGKMWYNYTNEFNIDKIIEMVKEMTSEFEGKYSIHRNTHISLINIKDSNLSNLSQKLSVIQAADEVGRSVSKKVIDLEIQDHEQIQNIIIMNTHGVVRTIYRPTKSFMVKSYARNDFEIGRGIRNVAKTVNNELNDEELIRKVTQEAAETSMKLINAQPTITGKYPVVLGSGNGIVVHEAVGHMLEANFIFNKQSLFYGKLGQQVAIETITVIDDGTRMNEWSSSDFDDEGTKTQKNILIENGILKNYLIDYYHSAFLDCKPTGNGRRQSYEFPPTARMTNTYINIGNHTFEDLIASIDVGLYCKTIGGGMVNPETSEISFSVEEGYLIKKGKIDSPIKGAYLTASGKDILYEIDMVADNLSFTPSICGSMSGRIPVTMGQPAIRVKKLLIGKR